MKGPSNVAVRLDLFPSQRTETHTEMKPNDREISKLDAEQLSHQVVFVNPEWDEIEEEKAGIPSFVNSITPNVSNDKSASPQVIEYIPTDTESVSSVTISLDEYGEDSEEIVAVITDSEPEMIPVPHVEEFENMLQTSEVDTVSNLRETDPLKLTSEDEAIIPYPRTPRSKPLTNSENVKRRNEPAEPSKVMKASCYVMQNGKITKPFYIVKNNPASRDEIFSKPVNKDCDWPLVKVLKTSNTATPVEDVKTFMPLGKNSIKKKENIREPQFAKTGRTQDFIRIIEHPAREKKTIATKTSENRVKNDANFAKPNDFASTKLNRNSDTVNSSESEDLMWLLDFKLDDLFNESALPALSHLDDNLQQYSEFPGKFVDVDGSISNFSESDGDRMKVEIGCQTETATTKSNKTGSNKPGVKQQPKIESKTDPGVQNRTFSDMGYSKNRKPPFTYTELIECALQEKGPLTVSEIYHWISETFPYYKSWDDRWKNSVRHNLSINPYFRKGTKARQGSGHLWTVNKSEDNSKMNTWKRQRFQEFEEFNKRLRLSGEVEKPEESMECISPSRMLDETELATASIEDKENRRLHRDVLMAACVDNNLISTPNVSLEQSAEEILSGVKKTVEVQYLEPVKSSSPCDNDFLNPISKEILMGECGLLNQIELNLTAETGEHLSIVDTMTDSEHIFGIPDELNFQYGDMTSHTPQLLSLAK